MKSPFVPCIAIMSNVGAPYELPPLKASREAVCIRPVVGDVGEREGVCIHWSKDEALFEGLWVVDHKD